MTFRTSTFFANLVGVPEPNDDFIVWWNGSGRSVFGEGRTAKEVLPGQPILLSRDRPTRVQHSDVTQSLVHLNHRFVETVARESGGQLAGFVSLGSGQPVTREATAAWRRAVNEVAALWLPDPAQLSNILRHELARLLALHLLNTFPRIDVPRGNSPAGFDRTKVRAAVEFAYSNAHLVMGSTEMAAAVGLSPRALQSAFRRHLNLTPTQLLRSIRLERVHDELAADSTINAQVSDIARQWGFTHLGRFAAEYFHKYRELPSDTLKRSTR